MKRIEKIFRVFAMGLRMEEKTKTGPIESKMGGYVRGLAYSKASRRDFAFREDLTALQISPSRLLPDRFLLLAAYLRRCLPGSPKSSHEASVVDVHPQDWSFAGAF